MNKTQRLALLAEFEQYIDERYSWDKEVVFSNLFDTKRRYRADYVLTLPHHCTIIEINGGQWTQGRHNRGGEGYEEDLNKLNIANANGATVLQFTYEMLKRQEYKEFI